jgi:hypothetical protein
MVDKDDKYLKQFKIEQVYARKEASISHLGFPNFNIRLPVLNIYLLSPTTHRLSQIS